MSSTPMVTDINFDESGRGAKRGWGRTFFMFDRDLIADYEEVEQERVITAFENFFARPRGSVSEAAPGRAAIERYFSGEGSSFVFRRNQRGGFVARFVLDWYVRTGRKYRPVEEFRLLKRLSQAGCAVPRPLGVLVQTRCGGLVYRGALATVEVPAAKNLLHAIREGLVESDAARFAAEAGKQAGQALREGACHADLHLGNIVISGGEKVYLVDWDKAHLAQDDSREYLVERFARSVHKHGRSELLIRSFCLGLDECR